MASKKKAEFRRKMAVHPAVHPELREYIKQLNAKVDWGTTTTSTTAAETTTTTS